MTKTDDSGVEVLVDLGGIAPAERGFIRVILGREAGDSSAVLATVEHHFSEPAEDAGGRSQWRQRTLIRREPIADSVAVEMAKEYATKHGIKQVFICREQWASDDTMRIRRPPEHS